MLCNELLTEAFTAESHDITEELVRAVADSRKLLPHVVPLQGKGRRKSDPDFRLVQPDEESGERITPRGSDAKGVVKKPKSKSKRSDAGDENLLEQISELSAQVGEFRSDKMQALEDLGARDKEISELHARLEMQTAESGKLKKTLQDHSGEIEHLKKTLVDSTKALQDSEKAATKLASELGKERDAAKAARAAETEKVANLIDEHSEEVGRLKQALADSTKALLQSEKASTKIAKDLEKERKAANTAQGEISKTNAKVEELNRLKADLETSLGELKADLKDADKRAAENGDRDKDTEELRDAIETKVGELLSLQGELDSRDEAYGELEELLDESKQECVALRLKVAVLKNLEESVAKKDTEIAALQEKLNAGGKKGKKGKKSKKGKQSKKGTDEAESAEVEQEQAERIAILESDLQEARNMLQRTQAQLTESEKIIAESDSKTPAEPQLELQVEDSAADAKLDSELAAALDSTLETKPEPEPEPEAEEEPAAEDSAGKIEALEVFLDGKPEQVLEIAKNGARIMVGRSEDSELCLKSEFVSRHHALILCSDEGLYIEDLNSFNGTLVNDEKISRCKLQAGDVVTIGKFEIKTKTA
jgi:hypothetical protein